MAQTFSSTIRSLERDEARARAAWLLAGMAFLSLWTGWFFLGRLPVYETADQARLEVEAAAHPVAARAAGQVPARFFGDPARHRPRGEGRRGAPRA